jgi:hypothetical protein
VQRRRKGADAPKKGRTAYVLFMMEYRAALKADVTRPAEADFATVSKQVSEAWKSMDAQAREPYFKQQDQEMGECVPCPLLEFPTPFSSPCILPGSSHALWLAQTTAQRSGGERWVVRVELRAACMPHGPPIYEATPPLVPHCTVHEHSIQHTA